MPAILGIGAVIAALMALLVIWGGKQFGDAIASLFPKTIGVSFASIHPRAWIEDAVAAAVAGAMWLLGDVIRPMLGVLITPIGRFLAHFQGLFNVIASAAVGFQWLVESGIPNLARRLESYTQHIYNLAVAAANAFATNVLHEAQHLYNLSIAYADTAATGVLHEAQHLYNLSIAYADHAVATAIGDVGSVTKQLAADVATIEAYATSYADAQAGRALTAAEAYASTAATTAVGVLSTGVDKAVDVVAPGLIEDLGSLVGTLASDFPDVSALVQSVNPADVLSLAGAVAGTMAITDALVKLADSCTVPNCRNLSSFGRDLQALLSLVGDASLLALIVEMVHDPSGAASDVQGLFGGLASDTITGVRDLIGV